MARIQRDPPRRFFERSEFRRLASFSFLLVILAMIIAESRGPGSLRRLIGHDGNNDRVVGKVDDAAADQIERVPGRTDSKDATPVAATTTNPATATGDSSANSPPASNNSAAVSKSTKSIPPATGVTDEDPDEAAAAEEDFQYIEDGTLSTLRWETPAYQRILRWVVDQPYARLAARSNLTKIVRSQIVAAADDDRGKLFQFDLHVRRVIKYDGYTSFHDDNEEPLAPVQLYEIWGNTDESPTRLYQLVVYDPPAGMPIGPDVREDVRFAGYFFKLQGYIPGKKLPDGQPDVEIAPTFIGRVLWIQRAPTVWFKQSDILWLAAVCGGFLIALVGWLAWLLMRQSRPMIAPVTAHLLVPRSASIDEWLDREESSADRPSARNQESGPPDANSDRATFQRILSDTEPDGDDGQETRPHANGHTNGHAERFSDGPG